MIVLDPQLLGCGRVSDAESDAWMA